ncbi:hypothetical protein CO058_00295 [candidate division WWE3 bacterium CG_4_9_14_0_2_um_filter_35_11]|uniref:Antitoxin n=1 Tax=candidate division WWE3 bacterium CG_4_9_14_0_2_um_filter_35_11 TaxID=1975077 RepID=A0A2M8EMV0_UNCKA|nr:MAG: hypothetical protein COV25_00255 [candidate division WWE3 bacterium CG10_big_fil_rev_8_21_14_0_10_35_32]PJC24055.1 MAG: hypothetical protein CO058_00295 [candidate division WWE3 bacterium CG_4_9_14_0_2_um_filter_35_11]
MVNGLEEKKIKIRDARPLLSKLSEEVAKKNSYYVITVRDKPVSMLTKYDEKLAARLSQNRNRKSKSAGEDFVSGISEWLESNPAVTTDENITDQIDRIVYGY